MKQSNNVKPHPSDQKSKSATGYVEFTTSWIIRIVSMFDCNKLNSLHIGEV